MLINKLHILQSFRSYTIDILSGIRMLDQPYMTDLIEANSMGHEPNLIDIYSASWGPTDDGRTVDGPRNATMRAIVRGVNEVSAECTFEVGLDGLEQPRNSSASIFMAHIKINLLIEISGSSRPRKHLRLGLRRRRRGRRL